MTQLSIDRQTSLQQSERRLLSLGAGAARAYPHVCLHHLIEAQVDRTPDAGAVSFEGAELSYRELDERANRLAHHLQGLGVGPDVVVGVMMERSPLLVLALLAVLKAGGAYLPLDPDYPASRLSFMIRDAAVPVLLSQGDLAARLPECPAEVLCLDPGLEELASRSAERPYGSAGPDNLAYVIYTSGSTGEPKGVMNEHRGIVNRLLWMQEEYELGSGDAVVQKTPFSFDVSVWEFFWPLLAGARLEVARPGGHQDPAYLSLLVQRAGITVMHFVPSMLAVFLDEPHLRDRCSSLRRVICSGEALPAPLVRRFSACLDASLHNLYGPTEAAVDVTHWNCEPAAEDAPVPIGRPVANTSIYILDEAQQPAGLGEQGELFIGGSQVARGYLGRPELTAERFLHDPFAERAGARMFKTGDLARFRADGVIEFLGRRDHQVKVRGFRIELGEIEAALAGCPGVRQAAVLATESAPGGRRLVAYTAAPGGEVTADGLRRHLQESLPEYMVPGSYVILDALPLLPNGKVDRKSLPALGHRRPNLEQAFVAPKSDLERFLAGLWCEVLELDRVGAKDKFFELGGTSIQAAQVVNRLQRELGEFIYIVTMFENPTVAEYAQFLGRDYPEALERRFGAGGASLRPAAARARAGHPPGAGSNGRVSEADLSALRKAVVTLPEQPELEGGKNPTAMFILSPPRSGTTLLRVMLAGHPQLFSAAELQLLGFNTLKERREAYSGKFSLWREGALRALMELRSCDADEAKGLMEDYVGQGLSTKAFYRLLQDWLAGRMLVDKSPSYALDPAALRKAEADFDSTLYIHLVRHPYAMIRSFERYHMDQVLYLREHGFTARQLGELVWTLSHRNTLEFLDTVPEERWVRIRYEDLVTRPEEVLQGLCARLGLAYHHAMSRPYDDLDAKMTDGLYKDSTPMGDTHLLERREIDPKMAEGWRGVLNDDFLGDPTWQLAESLGYQRPRREGAQPIVDHARREQFARQRQLRRGRRERRG